MNIQNSGSLPFSSEDTEIIQRGVFWMEKKTRTFCMGGKLIDLPPCAFACLAELVERYPEPVAYDQLVCASLGVRLTPLEAQDYCRWRVQRLRSKIEEDPARPRYIRTIPGYGYILNPE